MISLLERFLFLTIDIALQKSAEDILADKNGGAIVVIDAETGAIRAMASKPTFDPNFFSKLFTTQKEFDELFFSKSKLNAVVNFKTCLFVINRSSINFSEIFVIIL